MNNSERLFIEDLPRYTAFVMCPDGRSRRGVITVTPRLSNQDKKSVPPFSNSRKLNFSLYCTVGKRNGAFEN